MPSAMDSIDRDDVIILYEFVYLNMNSMGMTHLQRYGYYRSWEKHRKSLFPNYQNFL